MTDFKEDIERAKLRKELEEQLRREIDAREKLLAAHDTRMRALVFLAFTSLCFGLPILAGVLGLSFRVFQLAWNGPW